MTAPRISVCRARWPLALLCVLSTIAASPSLARDVAACEQADLAIRSNTPMSMCHTGNGDVTIGNGNCKTVYIDASYTGANALGAVTILAGGTLYVPDASVEIEAKSIVVAGASNALFQVGTDACPIGTLKAANHVIIRMIGERPADKILDAKVLMHHPKSADDCTTMDKGIGVGANGQLRLFGARGVPLPDVPLAQKGDGVSWTHLAQPVGPARYQQTNLNLGDPVAKGAGRTLHLGDNIMAGTNPWRAGDWIAIGTTSFSPYETEFVKIETVVNNREIVIDRDLRHYHFGSADPGLAYDPPAPGKPSPSFTAGAEKNFGVDERAEVALISRSITLTSSTPSGLGRGDRKLHWGGEIKVCKGFAEASIEGVEIEKFGKENLGSYPIHFHMANEVDSKGNPIPPSGKHLVNANSVHHSYNKCMTIHSTSNIKLQNNVCARVVGHIIYQEIGDEADNAFVNNVGLGAMQNNFDVTPALINKDGTITGFWEGDGLAKTNGYDGFKVANMDNQSNPVHGSCGVPSASGDGSLTLPDRPKEGDHPKPDAGAPPCLAGEYYTEAPSGFWIINPTAMLEGNSIGGCQGLGKAYWYVMPADPPHDPTIPVVPDIHYLQKFQPVGKFTNNRAHGCYDGIFGENELGTHTDQLFPKVGGDQNALNIFARFNGFTASRIRNRGVWMRPMWFVFDNARVATSRDAVSLVTSGGIDGNAPAGWGLLTNSVVVGLSRNNVDRWGPCGNRNAQEGAGCVDRNPLALDLRDKGYPSPAWNFAGFYIYDGPVRIHDTRFVNFRTNISKLLTTEDDLILKSFTNFYAGVKKYEGDAALGWFQNNQSAYPVATEVRGLIFDHSDFRHQVFTEKVNFGNFDDGDKNTAVVDRDGSLSGFKVYDSTGNPAVGQFPISLNNLPFNATPHAVDECHSEGQQDTVAQGNPTALMSPGNMATLEFGAMTPPSGLAPTPRMTQFTTFTKDQRYGTETDFLHPQMTLHSRNNQGLWEPKVISGYGYTVSVQSAITVPKYSPIATDPAGIPAYLNIGLTDALKPGMDKDPFYSRIGVCYTNNDAQGTHPDAQFDIERGYRSWGGNGTNFNLIAQRKYFNQLVNLFDGETCNNLDFQYVGNTDALKGCPADGVVPVENLDGGCPTGIVKKDITSTDVCVFEPTALTPVASIADLTNADGTPKDGGSHYYYDKDTGMLFFYVVQKEPNVEGPSPLGSCTGAASDDPACPNPHSETYPETYYGCPAQGCITYTVRMRPGANYSPGPSACVGKDPTAIYGYKPDANGKGIYELPEPANPNHLAYYVPPGTTVPDIRNGQEVIPEYRTSSQQFKHAVAKFAPYCPTGTLN